MPKKFSELSEDIFEILSEVNDHDARELHVYADNHADLHRQRTTPVHKNLRNKMASGAYDHEKAKKAFKHVTDDAAKRYKSEHGHHFDVATRKHVAGKMADRFHDEAKSGEHDHHLHKKYKGHKVKESVEQVDELDRSTIKSYQSKAAKDRGDRAQKIAQGLGVNFTDTNVDKKDYHKLHRRIQGMKKAKARTAEEVEQVDELDAKTLIRYNNAASQQVTRDTNTDTGKVTPKTTKRLKGALKARKKLDKIMPGLRGEEVEEEKKNKIKIKLNPKKKIGYEIKSVGPGGKTTVTKRRDMPGKDDIGESTEVMESFEFQFADKETAQEFMREISQKRLGSSTGTADGKVRTDGPAGAGVGSPTRAHQQMAKIMKKHGGKLLRTDEGPRMKRVFKEENEVEHMNEMSAKAHYKKYQNKFKVPPIDKSRYPNKEQQGLEGPYRSKKSGKVFYYDKKAGKYYDTNSDMYLSVDDVMESTELDELNRYTLKSYARKAHGDVEGIKNVLSSPKGKGPVSPKHRADLEREMRNRKKGGQKAIRKAYTSEDAEQVDELKTSTLKAYKNKARKDHSDAVEKGYDAKSGKLRSDFEARRLKRKAGFTKAMNKIIARNESPEMDEAMSPNGPAGLNPNFSGGLKAAQDTPSYKAYQAKVKADKKKRDAKIEKERETGVRSKYEEVETKKEDPMARAKMLRRAMMRKMVKDIKDKRVDKAKAKETNETTAMGQAVSGRRASPGTMSNTYDRNRPNDKRRGLTAKQSYQDAKAQRDRTKTDSNTGLSVKKKRVQDKKIAAKGAELERLHTKGYKHAFEETALERRAEKEKVQAVAASKAAKADRNRRKARAALRTYRSEKRRADSLGEAKEFFTAVAIKNGKVVDQLRDLEKKEFKDAAKYLKSANKGAKVSFENKSGKVVHTEGYDSKQALADVRKQTEKNQKARLKQAKAAKKFVQKHDCATHVEHVEFGQGQPINGQHASPDEDGNIAWYDVMFEHGVEKNMSTDDLTILMSEMHENHDHHGEEISEANFDEIRSKGKKLGDHDMKSYFLYKGNVWLLSNGRVSNRGPLERAKKRLNNTILKAIGLQENSDGTDKE